MQFIASLFETFAPSPPPPTSIATTLLSPETEELFRGLLVLTMACSIIYLLLRIVSSVSHEVCKSGLLIVLLACSMHFVLVHGLPFSSVATMREHWLTLLGFVSDTAASVQRASSASKQADNVSRFIKLPWQ